MGRLPQHIAGKADTDPTDSQGHWMTLGVNTLPCPHTAASSRGRCNTSLIGEQ
jgi:hypothetical protein